MAVRTVTALIKKPSGDPWVGGRVRFRLIDDTFLLTPDTSYPIQYVDAIANASGAISVVLTTDLATGYEVTMPDGETFVVYLPFETGATTTLERLRAIYSGVSPSTLPSLLGPTGPTGPGGAGPTGPTGAASTTVGPTGPGGGPAGRAGPGTVMMLRNFSTTITDADPTNGFIRLNNATQTSATQAFIDLVDTLGVTQTTLLDALDDSTNAIKGYLRIEKQADPAAYIIGTLTAVTTATGYRKLVFTIVQSSGASPIFANNDPVYVTVDRAGDAGTNGINGTNGTNGTNGATGATGATGPAGSTTTGGGIKFTYGDLAGGVIGTGVKGYIHIPFACTLAQWILLTDVSSTTTLDVWKVPYGASYPPVDANRIAGTNKPLTSAANKGSSGVSTWTTAVAADDILGFEVEANNNAHWLELTLRYQRTLP